jgi:hypothetical protein
MLIKKLFHTDSLRTAITTHSMNVVSNQLCMQAQHYSGSVAKVMMYTIDSERLDNGVFNQITFDIDSRTAYRVNHLAKFYFKINADEDLLLLKLILSEPNHEIVEWKKPNSNLVFGMHFIGQHDFIKADLSYSDAESICNRLSVSSNDESNHNSSHMSFSYDNSSLMPVYESASTKNLLHRAFAGSKECESLAVAKKDSCDIHLMTRFS